MTKDGKRSILRAQTLALTLCVSALLSPLVGPLPALAFDDDLDKNAKPLPSASEPGSEKATDGIPQTPASAPPTAQQTAQQTAPPTASDSDATAQPQVHWKTEGSSTTSGTPSAPGQPSTSDALTEATSANSTTTSTNTSTSPAHSDSKDWQTYQDVGGTYSMQYPNGWTVKTNAETGRIDVIDENNCELTVLPFFSTATKLEPLSFFKLFIKTYAPNEKWSKPVSAGTNAYKSYYENDSKVATAAIVLYPSEKGTGGKVCVTSAPKAVAQAQLQTFARIMSSFTAGNGKKPQTANGYPQQSQQNLANTNLQQSGIQTSPNLMTGMPAFRTFTDPTQHSFTMDVPVGWTVQGGLYRPVPIDARPWVTAVSPDKMCTIWVGDASIPPYTLPTATGMSLGYYPGKAYNGGIIAYYDPANKYIVQYGKKQLSRFSKNIKLETVQNYPGIAKQLNPGATSCAAASAKFTGMYGDLPMVSYMWCSTKETIMYGTGMWWVSQIGGVACAADRDMLGLAIFLRMSGSFKFDPSWFSESVATAGAISRQTAINAQIREAAMMNSYWRQQAANDANHAAYWDRQRVQNNAANNFSDYLRDQTNMVDPSTGYTYKVNYGPQYHYIDASGSTIVGSDSPYAPPNWQQLLAPPR